MRKDKRMYFNVTCLSLLFLLSCTEVVYKKDGSNAIDNEESVGLSDSKNHSIFRKKEPDGIVQTIFPKILYQVSENNSIITKSYRVTNGDWKMTILMDYENNRRKSLTDWNLLFGSNDEALTNEMDSILNKLESIDYTDSEYYSINQEGSETIMIKSYPMDNVGHNKFTCIYQLINSSKKAVISWEGSDTISIVDVINRNNWR